MNRTCNRCGAVFPVNGKDGHAARCGRCERSPVAGEGSGVIDIRTLGALMQREPGRPLVSPAAPAVTPAPARPRTPTAGSPSLAPLYAMFGLVVAGMATLAGHVLARPAPLAPEIHVVTVPRALAPEPEDSADAQEEEVREPEAAGEPAAVEAPEAPAPAAERRKPAKKPVAAAPTVKPVREQPAPAPASGPARDSVECLLKPETCAPKKVEPAPVVERPPAAPASGLPEKLEPADIIEGARPAKAAAAASCKALAKGGEIVKIKLSIAGPEGAVIEATPEDDAGNPKLAACCAAELAKATFKKVARARIGATVTVKF